MRGIIILMAIAFLSTSVVADNQSIEINITVDQFFEDGDVIQFNYSITSNESLNITYELGLYCSRDIATLEEVTLQLEANTSFESSYNYSIVHSFIEPQICSAFIEIIEPEEERQIVSGEFRIETLPSFSWSIYTCRDEECNLTSKIFMDYVYLTIVSAESNITVNATLQYPDNSTLDIELPYSFNASRIGIYLVTATVSKEGYKTMSQSLEFSVISEIPDITVSSECNGDDTCDPEENHQTCPQDCASGQLDGYCDLVEDEICDPDCNETRDEDCRIDYEVPMDEGWNLVSFPLEKLEGISAFILPLFFLLGILIWRIYI